MVKINNLSSNVTDVMIALKENDGLAELLTNNISNPFTIPVKDKSSLINPKNANCKIFPYPFDPEVQIEDSSFIRVYYGRGDFNENEVIQEMTMNIDIIVAKNLWLISDGQRSLIRPYEIMDRIVDTVGYRSANGRIRLKISGWQHLAVNARFEAIRLYCDYYNVESDNTYGNK